MERRRVVQHLGISATLPFMLLYLHPKHQYHQYGQPYHSRALACTARVLNTSNSVARLTKDPEDHHRNRLEKKARWCFYLVYTRPTRFWISNLCCTGQLGTIKSKYGQLSPIYTRA